MTPTINQLETWFDEYNELVFNSDLPKVKITINNFRSRLGQFYWGFGRGIGIKISHYWEMDEQQYRNILLHEMCHLFCYWRGWIHEQHGEKWQKIASYASRKTGLEIRRCTSIDSLEPSIYGQMKIKEKLQKQQKDGKTKKNQKS